MRKYYSLYGQLLSKQRLYEAFRHIKRNKGAAGIDGQSLSAFEANLEVELSCLLLKQWKKPSRLHRRLKQLGYQPPFRHIKMQSWRNAASPLASLALPNTYLHNDLKLMDLAKVKTGITVPEFGVS
jgi:hypothetical protein